MQALFSSIILTTSCFVTSLGIIKQSSFKQSYCQFTGIQRSLRSKHFLLSTSSFRRTTRVESTHLFSTSISDHNMTDNKNVDEYILPKVWEPTDNGGAWAKINRPYSGATHEKELPVGKHPLQLYSLATPNGIKVTIMLEELIEMGVKEAEYDAWMIRIDGDQFGSGFVELNPNSKIPALMDHSPPADDDDSKQEPLRVFESGSIMIYLGDKFGKLLPSTVRERTECINWVMWQMGSAPFVGGGFGHFFAYAPYKMEYPINRYTMETKRQLDVLDKHLAKNKYMVGDDYTIADIACWSWYGQIALGKLYDNSFEFLDMKSYSNVIRWAEIIAERPAVKRGKIVNKYWGPPEEQLWERHDASDFETSTRDKLDTDVAEK